MSIWLNHLGADVSGIALPANTKPSVFVEARIDDLINTFYDDIRNYERIQEIVNQVCPEIVIHLAAQSLVRPSYTDPVTTYATNVLGTVHLLDAVRRYGKTKVFLNVTSDKCYENLETNRPYKEDDQLGGHDPYSNSKACSEMLTKAFRDSYFRENEDSMALASARAGNVIGGGDWSEDRLMPDCIRSFFENKKLLIRNPDATRPWQHVLEPLSGYITLVEKMFDDNLSYSEAWNFGPVNSEVKPVRYIVDKLTSDLDNHHWDVHMGNHPHEAKMLSVDVSKAKKRLGWKPFLNLDETLNWTTDWYKRYYQGENAFDLTIEQVSNYMEKNSK